MISPDELAKEHEKYMQKINADREDLAAEMKISLEAKKGAIMNIINASLRDEARQEHITKIWEVRVLIEMKWSYDHEGDKDITIVGNVVDDALDSWITSAGWKIKSRSRKRIDDAGTYPFVTVLQENKTCNRSAIYRIHRKISPAEPTTPGP